MALTGLTLLTIGTAVDQKKRADRAEEKGDKLAALDRAQAADKAARERRKQIRQQSVAQAQIENAAAAQGQQGSSAPIAAAASVQAQVNENIGQINMTQAYGDARASLQQDIFNLQQPSNFQIAAGAVTDIFQVPKTPIK